MKQFKNFPQYAMDVNGDIYRINKKGLRKIEGQTDTKGYIQICLYLDGKRHFKMHHRLIAEEWIPNPFNKAQINHINGIGIQYNIFRTPPSYSSNQSPSMNQAKYFTTNPMLSTMKISVKHWHIA